MSCPINHSLRTPLNENRFFSWELKIGTIVKFLSAESEEKEQQWVLLCGSMRDELLAVVVVQVEWEVQGYTLTAHKSLIWFIEHLFSFSLYFPAGWLTEWKWNAWVVDWKILFGSLLFHFFFSIKRWTRTFFAGSSIFIFRNRREKIIRCCRFMNELFFLPTFKINLQQTINDHQFNFLSFLIKLNTQKFPTNFLVLRLRYVNIKFTCEN